MIGVGNMALLLPSPALRDVLKWATVTQASPLRIKVDGDSVQLPFTPATLEAGLAVSDRVLVAFVTNEDPEFIGQRAMVLGRGGGTVTVPAHTHAATPGTPLGELGFAERTSDSGQTSSTTELPIMSLDDIAIVGGRSIRVYTNTILVGSTANGDSYTIRLRYTTDGSSPTITSPEFEDCVVQTITTQGSGSGALSRVYHPASNETLSVLLTLQRRTGSGQLNTFGVTQITIEDIGAAKTDTGIDL